MKDLTFATFCGAISEKFCDLYWDEQLLQNLFKVVNGPASPSERSVSGPSLTFQSSGQTKPPNPVGSVPTATLIHSGCPRTAQSNSIVLHVIVAGVQGWGQGQEGKEPLVTGSSTF